jgi:hypothetical protein
MLRQAQSLTTRVTRFVVGGVFLAVGLDVTLTAPPTDVTGWVGRGMLLAVGLVLLPGVGEPLLVAARQVLDLVQVWRTRPPRAP